MKALQMPIYLDPEADNLYIGCCGEKLRIKTDLIDSAGLCLYDDDPGEPKTPELTAYAMA